MLVSQTNQSCLGRPHAGIGQEGRGKVGLLLCKQTMGPPEGPSFSCNSHLLANFLSHSFEQSLYHGALTCGWQSYVWERERKGKEKEIERETKTESVQSEGREPWSLQGGLELSSAGVGQGSHRQTCLPVSVPCGSSWKSRKLRKGSSGSSANENQAASLIWIRMCRVYVNSSLDTWACSCLFNYEKSCKTLDNVHNLRETICG